MAKALAEQEAGISKGAFYKFYPSKEMLFFEILEDMHTEIYEASAGVLKQNDANSPADRAAEAILTACKVMTASGTLDFMGRHGIGGSHGERSFPDRIS